MNQMLQKHQLPNNITNGYPCFYDQQEFQHHIQHDKHYFQNFAIEFQPIFVFFVNVVFPIFLLFSRITVLNGI